MAGSPPAGPSSMASGPQRHKGAFKRLRLGAQAARKQVKSLLGASTGKANSTSAQAPPHSTSTQAPPQPAVLSSSLGSVSAAELEAELAKQLLGVIPETIENAANLKARAAAQRAGAPAAEYVSQTDDPLPDPDAAGVKPQPMTEERRRKLETDFPILAWLGWDEVFLRELIRRRGRGDALKLTACPECGALGHPDYSCGDCEGAFMCRACLVHWHRYQPLHRFFDHSSGFAKRVEPSDLGLRIQLGHRPGTFCEFRNFEKVDQFTIMHTNGVHRIRVDFCSCDEGKDIPRPVQLLRRGLWPSTVTDPQSATSLDALDDFTRLSLLGRLTAYDYHKAAAAKTDGSRLKGLPDVRQQFMICVHEFRHIRMFMRAGRGHEQGGIEQTPSGACAVKCPACPDKKMNLVADWASRPYQWLYRAVLSLDANFRLSNCLSRSTNDTDPYLNNGSAYMPAAEDYGEHLKQLDNMDVDPPAECSRFGAINQANMKGGRGLRTTGVGACTCRHEFWQANGITTLRKGERQVCMDYSLCGALTHMNAPTVLVTYDVACQWHKNLRRRLEQYPEEREVYAGALAMLDLILNNKAVFCVPKFHLYAHKLLCQVSYALGWTVGTGAVDGEGPERCWSGTNGAASSLREMGPGTMHDTMDDICGAWNWQKICGMGLALADRMWRAVTEGREQSAIFTEFTEALEAEEAAKVALWRTKAERWETDPKKHKNPYSLPKKTATIKQIRLETELAQGSAASKIVDLAGATSTTKGAAGVSLAVTGKRGVARAPTLSTISESEADAGQASEALGQQANGKRKAPADPEEDYVDPEGAPAEDVDHDHDDEDLHNDGLEGMLQGDTGEIAARAQFLLLGLKIEGDRYRYNAKLGEDGETITQATTRTKFLNALVRDIEHLRNEQERFMPDLHATLTVEERNPERSNALTIKLWMPSDVRKDDDVVSDGVRALETRLRWASMSDELDNLLHQLRLRGCLNRFKITNMTGQRSCTRARTAQDAVDANVKAAANAYRRHRTAYFNLVGAGDWEKTMRVLADTDCRGLGDRLIEQIEGMSAHEAREFVALRKGTSSSGETAYKLPWIWYKSASDESGLQISDELMVEWLKNRARARNWVEEVWHVEEEMDRVLRFNESMARIWDARCYPKTLGTSEGEAGCDEVEEDEEARWAKELRAVLAGNPEATWDADDAWADGVRAYAQKQAWIRRQQALIWAEQFADARQAGVLFKKDHRLDGICTAPLVMLPDVPQTKTAKRRAEKKRVAGENAEKKAEKKKGTGKNAEKRKAEKEAKTKGI